jgi:hypothetical protein
MSTDYLPIPIKIQKEKRVPRPMNPFMCFAKHNRALLKIQLNISSNSDVSKELGNRWNKMPLEQKIVYIKEADEIKYKHAIEYPFYKYCPKIKIRKMPIRGVIETYIPTTPILKKIRISKKPENIKNISSDTDTEDEEEMDWFEYIQNNDWLK